MHTHFVRSTRQLLCTALLATAALGLGACAMDDTEPPPETAGAFAKEIVLTQGANTVVLTVSADDPALLERYDDTSYELTPLLARPAEPATGDEPSERPEPAAPAPADRVTLEETFVELEPGAIGYSLRYVGVTTYALTSCTSPNVHTSSRDNASVTVTSGTCTEAKISTKKYSWSWYAQKAYASALCPGAQPLVGGKRNTNRVKLEICPGPGYTYSFFN